MEKTKTMVIMAIGIVILLAILIYSQWDKIAGKEEKKELTETSEEVEEEVVVE